MARMHARKRGQASSTRPYRNQPPEWMPYDKDFVVKKVEELRRQGQSSAMIGVILRDQYGISNVKEVFSTKMNKIVEDLNLQPKYPMTVLTFWIIGSRFNVPIAIVFLLYQLKIILRKNLNLIISGWIKFTRVEL